MGWGDPPHQGYTARRLTMRAAAHNQCPDQGDKRWTAALPNKMRGTKGWESRCTFGWRSIRFHRNSDPLVRSRTGGCGRACLDRVAGHSHGADGGSEGRPPARTRRGRVWPLPLPRRPGGARGVAVGAPPPGRPLGPGALRVELGPPSSSGVSRARRPRGAHRSQQGTGARFVRAARRAELRWPSDDGRARSGGDARRAPACAPGHSCRAPSGGWAATRQAPLGPEGRLMGVLTGGHCAVSPPVVLCGHGTAATVLRQHGVSTHHVCGSHAGPREPNSTRT